MRVGFHAPDTVEELAYLVAEAADTRTPLEVMGRGTKREVGRLVQYGAVLSTESLVGVSSYEPTELVLVALAGTPVAQIEQMLAENDQELPFEPVDLGRACHQHFRQPAHSLGLRARPSARRSGGEWPRRDDQVRG